jgi:hypothetical protein
MLVSKNIGELDDAIEFVLETNSDRSDKVHIPHTVISGSFYTSLSSALWQLMYPIWASIPAHSLIC